MLEAMSSDERRRRPRPVEPPRLPDGPLKDLKAAVYELYLQADTPTLDEIKAEVDSLAVSLVELFRAGGVNEDTAERQVDELEGATPRRDTIGRIIGAPALPPSQPDLVAVVVALSAMAGRLPSYTIHGDLPALIAQVRRLWRRARSAPPPRRLGKPIRNCSPLNLEVHRAIEIADRGIRAPALPPYIPRAHDTRLRELVAACDQGDSTMITLVGGSSTGKTRACWEAVQALSGEWQLWHPIDPSRPAAAARDIAAAGPHTVVWLNEAQSYLLGADPLLSERISAGLRTLLDDPERGPVLILATMWPEYWATLTARPAPGVPDRHAQARELLSGTDLQVPDAFRGADLRALRTAATSDPRLRHAVTHADSGRVTQHLSGAPELLQRSRNAPATTRAIINVAIDARRLGHPPALPSTLLQDAAVGYVHDVDRQQAGDDWVDRAFAYALEPCHGVPGPLSIVRAGPDELFRAFGPPAYRLADYLEQVGREERADVFPPGTFWDAIVESVRDPDVLHTIGGQAERRGRNHRAAQLYRRSAEFGGVEALEGLGRLRLQAGDLAGAESYYVLAAGRGSIDALESRSWLRELLGHHTDEEVFLAEMQTRLREIAANNDYYERLYPEIFDGRDSTAGLLSRARQLRDIDDLAAAKELYEEAARLGDSSAVAELATINERLGDYRTAEALAMQAVRAGKIDAALSLVKSREERHYPDGAEAVAVTAGELGEPDPLYLLAELRDSQGNAAGLDAVVGCAAKLGFAHIFSVLAKPRMTDDPGEAWRLYEKGADLGDIAALQALALRDEDEGRHAAAEKRAARAGDLGDPGIMLLLANRREKHGDLRRAEQLYQRAAELGAAAAMRGLARIVGHRGDHSTAEELLLTAINRGNDGALSDLAWLHGLMGGPLGADRVLRFGLDDDGSPAAP